MRITQVVPSLEPQYGGPSRSVYALSAALARAGHDTALFATHPTAPESRTVSGLQLEIFRRDRPARLTPSADLKAALQKRPAEIIHHHALWLRTLHYAHRTACSRDAKLVISPRGMMSRWAMRHHSWQKRFARRFVHPGAFEAADGWHATSQAEADEIRALGFNQPICVAPNGVDEPTSADIAAATAYWRTVCPAVALRPVALFYSRFHQKKRVIELIDLWLEHAPRDWLLLLVGIPETYTPAMLETYVMRQSGAGRVQAFSGTDCPVPYPIASLFLLPSHNENFGLVVAEAMAHGVPAVVTDTTPWHALNTDARGWCVPWDDYAAALKSATAATPPALRARGLRARDWVLSEFAWDKSARDLATFYGQLCASTR